MHRLYSAVNFASKASDRDTNAWLFITSVHRLGVPCTYSAFGSRDLNSSIPLDASLHIRLAIIHGEFSLITKIVATKKKNFHRLDHALVTVLG